MRNRNCRSSPAWCRCWPWVPWPDGSAPTHISTTRARGRVAAAIVGHDRRPIGQVVPRVDRRANVVVVGRQTDAIRAMVVLLKAVRLDYISRRVYIWRASVSTWSLPPLMAVGLAEEKSG